MLTELDAHALSHLPRALDLERVLTKADAEQIREEMGVTVGGKVTVGQWKSWWQKDSPGFKKVKRLKHEKLADDELCDVIEQMRSKEADKFCIGDEPTIEDMAFDVARDTKLLVALAYTVGRAVQVYSYSTHCIFDSDEHVPHAQTQWQSRAADAAREGFARDSGWSAVELNSRGKAREPIRLALHLFPRRFQAIMRARLPTEFARLPGGEQLTDHRVVRLLAVEGRPAASAARFRRWQEQWWQSEDSCLWCLLGHVWQLVRPPSAGEQQVRAKAVEATQRREAAAQRLQAARSSRDSHPAMALAVGAAGSEEEKLEKELALVCSYACMSRCSQITYIPAHSLSLCRSQWQLLPWLTAVTV